MKELILSKNLGEILRNFPYAEDYFTSMGIKNISKELPIDKYLDSLPDELFEDCGMERWQIIEHFHAFMKKMDELKKKSNFSIDEITIVGGMDKSGNPENISLSMKPGEIICIVGQTGSGKSRLLADIECLAQGDTPSGRQILINGLVPRQDKRFSIEHKLVAQLSQNMNFIMDITVEEFIQMHAESRMVPNIEEMVLSIINCANDLAGEKFTMDTPVTALSGGQSRALMISDTALLSVSPIVLIDEIENAGVDRKKALELLVKKEKIVLMSTHDPILALMGDKRIVIKNGGMSKVIRTGKEETENLQYLRILDQRLLEIRNLLRNGEQIDFSAKDFLNL
jgi:ABC-type lipoprotein export system ATPase subunit